MIKRLPSASNSIKPSGIQIKFEARTSSMNIENVLTLLKLTVNNRIIKRNFNTFPSSIINSIDTDDILNYVGIILFARYFQFACIKFKINNMLQTLITIIFRQCTQPMFGQLY